MIIDLQTRDELAAGTAIERLGNLLRSLQCGEAVARTLLAQVESERAMDIPTEITLAAGVSAHGRPRRIS